MYNHIDKVLSLLTFSEVLTHRTKLRNHTPIKTTPTKTTSTSTDHDVDVDDDDNPFSGVFSDDQSTDDSEEGWVCALELNLVDFW